MGTEALSTGAAGLQGLKGCGVPGQKLQIGGLWHESQLLVGLEEIRSLDLKVSTSTTPISSVPGQADLAPGPACSWSRSAATERPLPPALAPAFSAPLPLGCSACLPACRPWALQPSGGPSFTHPFSCGDPHLRPEASQLEGEQPVILVPVRCHRARAAKCRVFRGQVFQIVL